MCVSRLCDKQLGWFVKRIWWQWNFSNHGFIHLKTENNNRFFWRLVHRFQIPQFDSTLLKSGGIINYFQVFGQLLGSRWIAYAWEIWAHQRVSSDFHIICVACPLHCMCNLIEYTPLERWLPIHSPFSCHGSTHPLPSPCFFLTLMISWSVHIWKSVSYAWEHHHHSIVVSEQLSTRHIPTNWENVID